MMLKKFIILGVIMIIASNMYSQNNSTEWFGSCQTNLYFPISTSTKGTYPILWYDRETNPKVLIGGFGVGTMLYKPIKNKLFFKGIATLSKISYWDEPLLAKDFNGNPQGEIQRGSSDYLVHISGLVHYFFTDKISVGGGLGTHLNIVTFARIPTQKQDEVSVGVQRHYKTLMPIIPLELSYKTLKKVFSIRYEQGLLNRYKKDLAQYKKEKLGLLMFEIGFKI